MSQGSGWHEVGLSRLALDVSENNGLSTNITALWKNGTVNLAAAPGSVLQPGVNCWRITHSPRFSVLVDAQNYYSAFADAAAKARRTIRMLAWDINTEIRLHPGEREADLPDKLGDFLIALCERRPELEIHILCWAGAIIYESERMPKAKVEAFFARHPRIHFKYTAHHPPMASDHEKIVIIDGAVAFQGGLDLTRDRWDTQSHLAYDPRRINPLGDPCRPFHEVHSVCDGETALTLEELFRSRWEEATGERLPVPYVSRNAWPTGIEPDFHNVRIGISRTNAKRVGVDAIREIARFYHDAILGAKRYIYIECEYLTSQIVSNAIIERLREPDGPEVVIVGPLRCTGWVEESTMGSLRERCVLRMQEADLFGKLRFYYPTVPGIGNDFVSVHSKLMIVDDTILHIGSANLSNRSLGVDTETDLTIESDGDAKTATGIRAVVSRLLGEHLGVAPETFQRTLETKGSLHAAIDAYLGDERTLLRLPLSTDTVALARAAVPDIVDPNYPLRWETLVSDGESKGKSSGFMKWWPRVWPVTALLLMLAVGAAWRWTPLREWAALDNLSLAFAQWRESPWLPLALIAAYVAGGLIMFPVLGLILLTALLIPPPLSFVWALAGSLSSAMVLYTIGRFVRRELLEKLAGEKMDLLRSKLGRYGVLAITVLRLVPIVPFSIFNLVCGGMHIRPWDFFLGTLLGLAPGALFLTLLGAAAESAVTKPSLGSVLSLLGLAAAALAMATLFSQVGARGREARR